AVVLRCLSKDPNDRYPDTSQLAEALNACADASNWSPEHAAAWWRSHGQMAETDGKPTEPAGPRGADRFEVTAPDGMAADHALHSVEPPRMIESRMPTISSLHFPGGAT